MNDVPAFPDLMALIAADPSVSSDFARITRRPMRNERAFDVTYEIGGVVGRQTVYAINTFAAIEEVFAGIEDGEHMVGANIKCVPV
jgi:hypothetical protein